MAVERSVIVSKLPGPALLKNMAESTRLSDAETTARKFLKCRRNTAVLFKSNASSVPNNQNLRFLIDSGRFRAAFCKPDIAEGTLS